MLTEFIFKAVVEKIDHAIIIADVDGNFILWNASAKKILGINESIKSKEAWQSHFKITSIEGVLYNNNDLPIMKALNGEFIDKERLYISDPSKMKGAFLEVDAFPILNENGQIVAAAASFTDVTKNIEMGRMIDEWLKTIDHLKTLISNSFFT